MKKIILAIILVILPAVLFAAEPTAERPHWSLELKGGNFIPDIEDWSTYYGKRYMSQYGGSLAYKLIRQIEVGIEGMYSRDSGQGLAPLHTQAAGGIPVFAGRVTYEVAPLNVFVLVRGLFNEKQWIVPYAGGGWTRMFYREEVEHQGVVRGSVNGYHARGGIQFLLDALDPHAANNLYRDYGIYHTYLFLEGKHTRAMVDTVDTPSRSVNLGGTSWLGGLLFEF